jgi:hypothetical protein
LDEVNTCTVLLFASSIHQSSQKVQIFRLLVSCEVCSFTN